MGSFDAAVVGPGGEALAPHGREWGDATARWGGCRRTGVSFLDSEEPAKLRADLRVPRDAASRRGRRRPWRGRSAPSGPPAASTPPPRQFSACSSMLARELESRERSKRAGLLRQAGIPVPKAGEGLDWSHVRLPEGWGCEEILSLDFVGRAEDLVFHGPTGRGKTHVATALGVEATLCGIPVRFHQPPRSSSGSARRSGRGPWTGWWRTSGRHRWSCWTSSARSLRSRRGPPALPGHNGFA